MDLDDLARAQAAVSALLGDLVAADWGRPTPCGDWDVAAVVRHLHTGERAFTTSLGGTSYDLGAIAAEVGTVGLDALPAAYDAGAMRLRTALAAADPAPAYPTGIGPMTATAIAELRTLEALAHGWDLARGTGRPLGIDDGVAERTIGPARALLARLPPERRVFGAPQPVADDAAALDRLVALLGRTVSG